MSGVTAAFALLALAAGIAGSIQVAVMGRFGERIGSFEALLANLGFSTLLAALVLVAVRQGAGGLTDALRAPWWYWLGGGGMGILVVLSITLCAPRLGATATIGVLIAGQLAMGVAIDRLGLFGVEQVELTWVRLTGVALLAAGAALALYRG
ncbi:MAG TPA: DMT family transporter [Gaiellaceae bacterium]|nr:DMT family transporter [Gaiellaceae bacterium]